MTRYLASLLVVGLLVVVGCTQSEPGGGTTRNESFKLTTPALPTLIKQGDTQTITVTVNRGTDFKEDVKLEAQAPKGIHVDLSDKDVKASANGEVKLKIHVDKDAPLGNHAIKLTGKPEKGAATTAEITVKVQEG